MEVTQVGVRTRARAIAMATVAMAVVEENADNSVAVLKRRKLSNDNLRSTPSTFAETKTIDREIYVNSTPEEETSDSSDAGVRSGDVPASCCSSTGSMEKQLKVSDLEVESCETVTAARYNLDGIESTPTDKFKAKSSELDTTTVKQSSVMINSRRTVLPAEKMPPEAELEEFFAAAQEDLNKRFKRKYNYDIVNDIPLKGRFEWIEVSKKNDDEDDE